MSTGQGDLEGVGELVVSPDVAFKIVQREAVVVNLVGHEVMALNEVAARFLELVAAGTPVGRAVDVIHGEYEVERDRLEADLVGLVDELLELGVLRRVTTTDNG